MDLYKERNDACGMNGEDSSQHPALMFNKESLLDGSCDLNLYLIPPLKLNTNYFAIL